MIRAIVLFMLQQVIAVSVTKLIVTQPRKVTSKMREAYECFLSFSVLAYQIRSSHFEIVFIVYIVIYSHDFVSVAVS